MDKLKVEGFFSPDRGEKKPDIPDNEIIAFSEFELIKHVGEHSTLKFTAPVKSSGLDSFKQLAGHGITVSRSGDCIFRGVVKSVRADSGKSSCYISVSAVSWSASADEEAHTRIFRNENKTFKDILSSFEMNPGKKFSSCGAQKVSIECRDKAAADNRPFPVMQNNLTDIVFARNIAEYCSCRLWINDRDETPSLLISEKSGSLELDENEISYFAEESTMSGTRFFIETDRIIPMGTELSANIHGVSNRLFKGIVTEMQAAYHAGVFTFTYTAEESRTARPCNLFYRLPPVTLTAEVTDNSDSEKKGRVAVSFEHSIAQELLSDKSPMIPVSQLNLQGSSITAKGSSEIAMKCNNIRLN